MNVVIILCLVYMLALCGTIAFRLVKCSRKERLKRLKGFKHGKFALIYFAAIPLVFLAQRFNGQSVDGALWLSVRASVEFVVLKFDYNTVAPLIAQSVLYHAAVEILFTLILCNTLMLTASLCGQAVANRISLFLTTKLRKKVVLVMGTDENSLQILGSVPKGHRAVLLGEMTPALKDEAYVRKADYWNLKDKDKENLGELLEKRFGNFAAKKVSVIMNTGDDEKSLLCVKELCALIGRKKLQELSFDDGIGLTVYVFASKENEDLFACYAEASGGVIRIVNRHKQIAMDFIDRYPLTQFMTERELDFSTATVHGDVGLNMFLIGFGKLNESLFLTSVSNNQFLTLQSGKLVPKPVTYHIYDRYYPEGKFTKESKVHSGSLHHGYFRYEAFLDLCKKNGEKYLEPAPLPANIVPHPLEVTHPDFYSSIRGELMKKNAYSYIVVSFGTDMENMELAEKLQQKIKEWAPPSVVKIFVKVRDEKFAEAVSGDFGMIRPFGADGGCVYNAQAILHEKIEAMARLRHLLYAAEREVKKAKRSSAAALEDGKIRDAAKNSWFAYGEAQRESNVYACLSLRMKLQLCGFDYAECDAEKSKDKKKGGKISAEEKNADGKISAEEKSAEETKAAFLAKYEEGDKRIPSPLKTDGAEIWEYTNEGQFNGSLRWTFAVQEHQRWCANLIARGFIPCEKEEIPSDKAELAKQRKHANLTTMEGLVEFREIMAEAKGKSAEETDVIRYDYQLMDDAAWLLEKCGYRLIRKAV